MSFRSAVRQTLRYSQFFNFSLTKKELHYWLIDSRPTSWGDFDRQIKYQISPSQLRTRRHLQRLSATKLASVHRLIHLLKVFPNIKLIALTGSLAVNNPSSTDDIDLMFIVSSHTLWLSRPFILLLVSLFFPLRHAHHQEKPDSYCPNLWLDDLALTVPSSKRSLYTAHEVLQIRPLFNKGDTYKTFILANAWTRKYLANAYQEISTNFTANQSQTPTKNFISSTINHLFSLLNTWAFRVQKIYMQSKLTHEYVTPHSAYFHPTSYTRQINKHMKTNSTN